jgi:hypothetical protein
MNSIIVRKLSMVLVVIMLAVNLTACSPTLSKKEQESVNSFGVILNTFPVENEDGWYQLTAPDGGAKFVYSNDCAWLAVDTAPFIAAGLNVETLDNISETVFYEKDMGFRLPAWDMLNLNIKDTALEQFKADIRHFQIVETDYTYRINFTDDNNTRIDSAVFEWAKAPSEICAFVFTLNAEPLIAAGVDPEKVEGWDYVETPEGGMSFQKVVNSLKTP